MAERLQPVLSRIDALKRQLYDALTNPRDYASMLGGRIQESGQAAKQLQSQAFADPRQPFKVTNEAALRQLTDMMMAGPLGFAQLGMVKPEQAARVLRSTKVVDEAGNPKMMYHGTPESFEDFELGRTQLGAIFASPDPNFASKYAGQEYTVEVMGKTPNVRPVYVDSKNPFDYENPEHVNAMVKWLKKNNPDFRNVAESIGDKVKDGFYDQIERPIVQDAIRSLGFDGFYVKEGGAKNIAVFDPTQIKSAISDSSFKGLLDK